MNLDRRSARACLFGVMTLVAACGDDSATGAGGGTGGSPEGGAGQGGTPSTGGESAGGAPSTGGAGEGGASACEAPFESFRYRLDVGGGGAGGEAYEVAATILWREGDRERTIRVDTLMASRLGEEADPDRKPKERVERPT